MFLKVVIGKFYKLEIFVFFMKNIDGIVIPTGNEEQDLERAQRALEYGASLGQKSVDYIVSGIGPDMNVFLSRVHKVLEGQSCPEGTEGLDFHSQLYYFLRWQESVGNSYSNKENKSEIVKLKFDDGPLDSRMNLQCSFPEGTKGRYALVSYPLHLWRFGVLEKKFKKNRLMSRKVTIEHVPTKRFLDQSPSEMIYGTLALIKDVIK